MGLQGFVLGEEAERSSRGREDISPSVWCGDPERWMLTPLELESCLFLGTSCAFSPGAPFICAEA